MHSSPVPRHHQGVGLAVEADRRTSVLAGTMEVLRSRSGSGGMRLLLESTSTTLAGCKEEGAGHHELAWQWRLTGALQFLLGPWKA